MAEPGLDVVVVSARKEGTVKRSPLLSQCQLQVLLLEQDFTKAKASGKYVNYNSSRPGRLDRNQNSHRQTNLQLFIKGT